MGSRHEVMEVAAAGRKAVLSELRRQGLVLNDDNRVNGHYVVIRSARHRRRSHAVCNQGVRYKGYFYWRVSWNCHIRGRRLSPWPDVFLFYDLTDRVLYLVPGSHVIAKSVHLHVGNETSASRSWLVPYLGRYDLLRG